MFLKIVVHVGCGSLGGIQGDRDRCQLGIKVIFYRHPVLSFLHLGEMGFQQLAVAPVGFIALSLGEVFLHAEEAPGETFQLAAQLLQPFLFKTPGLRLRFRLRVMPLDRS